MDRLVRGICRLYSDSYLTRDLSMPFDRPTGPINPSPDAGFGANAQPDLSQGFGAGLHGAESAAQGAAMKISAEATALSGKALAAVGHAALAAVPGAEPISPIIQLIMKMPGAMGLMNNFFEMLQNFFSGENLVSLFDGSMLQHALGSQAAMLHNLATGAEHFTMSLAHLPGDGSMMGAFNNMMNNGMRFDLGQASTTSVGEHFSIDPANVGAPADLQHAQFEGAAGRMTSGVSSDGAIAGPAVTHGTQANFLAGNQRLFSDRIGSGGNFNSVTNATQVPTANSIPNNSGATFGADANVGAPKFDGATTGPAIGGEQVAKMDPSIGGSVLDKYGSNKVVASDVGTYRPGTSAWTPNHGSDLSGSVEPMKAQQLSYGDLKSAAPSRAGVDSIGHQVKAFKPSTANRIDGIGHSTVPKAYSQTAFTPQHAPHNVSAPHHSVAHHAAPKHVEVAHHAAPKHVEVAQKAAPVETAQDQTQIAQATDASGAPTDATATPTEHTYTVHKGDSLWNIAQKQLGDGNKWTEIYKANADTIGQNPNMIFSGTELKLPGAMDQSVASASQYVVKPGDNLWDIAKHQLGDGNKWGDLYKANADVIGHNPGLIQPGQTISMPGAAPTEGIASADPGAAAAAQSGIAQNAPAAGMPNGAVGNQVAMNGGAPMDAQQMAAAQQQAALQQQLAMQQQMQMQQMAAAPQNYGGAAYAGDMAQPVAQNVLQAQPTHNLPIGPGAAGASEIPANPADAVVSSALAPDLSWIKE